MEHEFKCKHDKDLGTYCADCLVIELRGALRFYADLSNYHNGIPMQAKYNDRYDDYDLVPDNGGMAREALGKIGQQT